MATQTALRCAARVALFLSTWGTLAQSSIAQRPMLGEGQLIGQRGARLLEQVASSRTHVSIEDFGAVPGDPSAAARNVVAINRAFEAAGLTHYTPVVVPGRAYYINDTIEVPKRTGLCVLGNGGGSQRHESEYREGRLGGPNSRLVWTGPPDRPMVRFRGEGLFWRGLQLHGRPQRSDAPKPAIGLLVENGQAGLGPGKLMAPYFAAFDCRVGVQFGSQRAADNGDVSQFGRLHVEDCDVGMKVIGRQSLDFNVQHVRNQRCGVVFDFHSGGGLHVYGGHTLAQGGTVLRVSEDVEVNAGVFRIQGWHVDAPAARSGFKLLEMTGRTWAHVTIQADLPPHIDYPTPIANVTGPTCLRLVDTLHLQASSIECHEHRAGSPVVLVEGCRLKSGVEPSQLVDAESSTGNWSLSARDCYSHSGRLFPDYRKTQ